MNILDFSIMRDRGDKIAMVTCYDYAFAKILANTDVDCLLVGDSVAMVKHGFPSTVHATLEMMVMHTAAVARGAGDKFIIADLPFLTYRQGLEVAMQAVQALMQAGAHAVKLEGLVGNTELIRHIVDSGVPVMGHLGLTPQAVHQLGGHRVQAKADAEADLLLEHAQSMQQAGCFSIVLECIPAALGKTVTDALSIPTIGIGAGADTSGQVLVLPDLLGMDVTFKPKLLKQYTEGYTWIKQALDQYASEVKQQQFPTAEHSY